MTPVLFVDPIHNTLTHQVQVGEQDNLVKLKIGRWVSREFVYGVDEVLPALERLCSLLNPQWDRRAADVPHWSLRNE